MSGPGCYTRAAALVLTAGLLWAGCDVTELCAEGHAREVVSGQDHTVSDTGDPATEGMTDIIDIRPPVAYGMDRRLFFLALAVAAVLAGFLVLWFWRKKRRTTGQAPVLPPVPEDVVALDALRDLESNPGMADREYYFRLTGILREYLDRRYGTDTLEKTTEELVPAVGRIPVDPNLRTSLLNLLREADPVKYASAPAGTRRRKEDLTFALAFVRSTRRLLEEGKQHVPV